jgi:hypothetical protein
MAVSFDNDETSCGSGLQPALQYVQYMKQANGGSCGKDLGIFWYYPEMWIEPCSSTTICRHMRSITSRLLFEKRNVHFQAIWLQEQVTRN